MAKTSKFREPIRLLRVKQDMTQADLAKHLGVGQTAVSAWETGDNTPPADALVKMGNIAPYPDCLFFYEKAGMDLKRITAVGDTLKRCLDFVKQHTGTREFDQLQVRIAGMNQEDQLAHVLQSMGGLPGLAHGLELGDVETAFGKLIEHIDPGYAKRIGPLHLGGSAYDRIRQMSGAAMSLLRLKKKKHPWERDGDPSQSLGAGPGIRGKKP